MKSSFCLQSKPNGSLTLPALQWQRLQGLLAPLNAKPPLYPAASICLSMLAWGGLLEELLRFVSYVHDISSIILQHQFSRLRVLAGYVWYLQGNGLRVLMVPLSCELQLPEPGSI